MTTTSQYPKKPVRRFIQRRADGYLETVDEFGSTKEARAMLSEYRMADPSASYYVSTRACKAWKQDGVK